MRFLISALFLFTFSTSAFALDAASIAPKEAFVIDAQTGAVLLDKNGDERMATSSMSKVLTMFVVFDAIKEGRLKLDDTLPVSENAWRMQGSKMFVHVGDRVKVEDLVRGVIVQSGNDACIVLAEAIGGSESGFAEMMNAKAKSLGLDHSNFSNSTGWPADDHYSTARDLAKLGLALVNDYADFYHYYSEKDFTYNNIKQGNRNPLLYKDIGADGIKTGHTDTAGYGLIGSAVQNGRRVVMVVNGMTSMQQRADESGRIIEWALREFDNVIFKAYQAPIASARVVLGEKADVPVTLGKDFLATLPKAGRNTLKFRLKFNEPLTAPISKGQEVGTMVVLTGDKEGDVSYPLVAAEDVKALNFLSRTMAKAIFILTGKAG